VKRMGAKGGGHSSVCAVFMVCAVHCAVHCGIHCDEWGGVNLTTKQRKRDKC